MANNFVWHELMTTDPKAAEAFYTKVIGWKAQPFPGGAPYTVVSAGETGVGGIMEIPAEAVAMGAKPSWHGYVAVDDVDVYAEKVKAAGGRVYKAPDDIPNVGRFAVVADRHGAVFQLFKASSDYQPTPAPAGTPGLVGWNELMGGDLATDFPFYEELFGWKKLDGMDMGPMGIYQIFATDAAQAGGMMTKTPDVPHPHWRYYFNVEDVDAAIARTGEAGGTVTNGPHQVPGGSWIAHATDPQGVSFAMVGPRPNA